MIDEEKQIGEGNFLIEKRGTITFVLGDNKEWLSTVPYKHYHLVVDDPPYGIGIGGRMLGASMEQHKNRTFEMGEWDNAVPKKEYWDLLHYTSRNFIVWGGNYFTYFLPPARCFIVWDKQNDNLDFAGGELALTSFDRNAEFIRLPRNAKKSTDGSEEKRHPTQKPVYLYDWIHTKFQKPDSCQKGNYRVFDGHGGSFNHAIAAYRHGINLTIIDKNKSYFESALKAFDKATTAGRLIF